jgi:hypothetical protein
LHSICPCARSRVQENNQYKSNGSLATEIQKLAKDKGLEINNLFVGTKGDKLEIHVGIPHVKDVKVSIPSNGIPKVSPQEVVELLKKVDSGIYFAEGSGTRCQSACGKLVTLASLRIDIHSPRETIDKDSTTRFYVPGTVSYVTQSGVERTLSLSKNTSGGDAKDYKLPSESIAYIVSRDAHLDSTKGNPLRSTDFETGKAIVSLNKGQSAGLIIGKENGNFYILTPEEGERGSKLPVSTTFKEGTRNVSVDGTVVSTPVISGRKFSLVTVPEDSLKDLGLKVPKFAPDSYDVTDYSGPKANALIVTDRTAYPVYGVYNKLTSTNQGRAPDNLFSTRTTHTTPLLLDGGTTPGSILVKAENNVPLVVGISAVPEPFTKNIKGGTLWNVDTVSQIGTNRHSYGSLFHNSFVPISEGLKDKIMSEAISGQPNDLAQRLIRTKQ